jgi:Tol biopolymer transport system component
MLRAGVNRALLPLLLLVLSFVAIPRSIAYAANHRCFGETGQCISGRIRQFWEQNGGLPVFGYPVTPQRAEYNRDTGQVYQTQWFERARLELHPENRRPYDVLLGRLGDDALSQRGIDWRNEPKAAPNAARRFAPTGHAIAFDPFWNYWRTHGLEFDGRRGFSMAESLALFGMPITEPRTETNASGDTVLTQWFERARFEYHPNKPDPYKVLLGLLGNELLGAEGLMPPVGRIAFMREANVYVANADGTGERRLTDVMPSVLHGGVRWSPDGRTLAFTTGENLYVVPADGSAPARSIARVDSERPQTPFWSPDSRRLGFNMNGDVHAINADGSGLTNLTNHPADELMFGWSPDGSRVLVHAISEDLGFYLINADGSGRVKLPSSSADVFPSWSPDGRQIVCQSIRNGYDWDVIVMNADGSNVRSLTQPGPDEVSPVWSPDSQRIAFASYGSGGDSLNVINADGTGRRRLASIGTYMIDPVSWSPDGRHIAFSRGGSIFVTGSTSGAAQVRVIEGGSAPAWSPN